MTARRSSASSLYTGMTMSSALVVPRAAPPPPVGNGSWVSPGRPCALIKLTLPGRTVADPGHRCGLPVLRRLEREPVMTPCAKSPRARRARTDRLVDLPHVAILLG